MGKLEEFSCAFSNRRDIKISKFLTFPEFYQLGEIVEFFFFFFFFLLVKMYLSQRGKSCYQEQLLQDLLDKNEACRRSHIVTMVCKLLHNLAPDYLRAKIVDRDSVTSYALGDMVNKLAVPQPRTNYLKNAVKSHIKGLGLYNEGPRSIFEIGGGGGGTISASLLGEGHKTLFITNSL